MSAPVPVLHLAADPAALARLRAILGNAGYTSERIDELIGADLTALGQRAVPVVVRRTAGGSPLETLVRLFMAGVPVPRKAADAALAPDTAEQWADWGLLTLDSVDATAHATVQLACHGDLVVATDWGPTTPSVGTAPDHVMGLSPSTLTLARMTVRQPSRATLDLGTGCGLQALLAAPHSERVIAVELNPRAVAMARFNAALNNLDNVECRQQDMLQALGDGSTEVFDSIVSNPPFVVGPRTPHLFMSSPQDPAELCRDLARSAPRRLATGGWCQFLANWAPPHGRDWREHLAEWFAGVDCDAWVIRRERQPVDEYAALWIETDRDDAHEYARRFDEWMRWYDERGIDAVDYGLVTMRKRADATPGRLRLDDMRSPWDTATGDDIAAAFARHDWLDATDDDALLDARLRVSDAARLRRELVAVRGEWVPVSAQLRVDGGIGAPGGVDPHGERIVARCDGVTPLAALLDDLAGALDTTRDAIATGALGAVRALVDRGVLLP